MSFVDNNLNIRRREVLYAVECFGSMEVCVCVSTRATVVHAAENRRADKARSSLQGQTRGET